MGEKKQAAQNLTGTLIAPRPRRNGTETVEFSVKGPIAVSLDEDDITSPGCSVLDLQLPTPSQVGELVFRNYYTAWLTVLTRFDSSIPRTGAQGKVFVLPSKGAGTGTKSSEQIGNWVVSVPRRVLMTNPHLENGSHDFVSILATESQVEWKNVVTIRLVLRQPSPIWRTFHVEELNIYHDLPRRVPRPLQHSHPITDPAHCQQYDTLLTLVRHQTVTALHWVPEPKDSNAVKDNTWPCGYEFFSLPQI